MGGDHEDKGPYRTSVDPPRPSAPPRSPRVLSALARLRSAHGDDAESAALSERASLARTSMPLARCTHGHELLRSHDLDGARATYARWLALASERSAHEDSRLEVLCLLAVLQRGDERERALREAVRLAHSAALPSDAILAARVALAQSWRHLGEYHRADAELARVTESDAFPLPTGSLEFERAHTALHLARIADAEHYVRAAASARSAAYGERHPDFAECATLAGRILQRTHQPKQAGAMFREAFSILYDAEGNPYGLLAETLGAYAEWQWDRGHENDARNAAFNALKLIDAIAPSAAVLPALRSAARVFGLSDDVTRVRALDERIASLRALYVP